MGINGTKMWLAFLSLLLYLHGEVAYQLKYRLCGPDSPVHMFVQNQSSSYERGPILDCNSSPLPSLPTSGLIKSKQLYCVRVLQLSNVIAARIRYFFSVLRIMKTIIKFDSIASCQRDILDSSNGIILQGSLLTAVRELSKCIIFEL